MDKFYTYQDLILEATTLGSNLAVFTVTIIYKVPRRRISKASILPMASLIALINKLVNV